MRVIAVKGGWRVRWDYSKKSGLILSHFWVRVFWACYLVTAGGLKE